MAASPLQIRRAAARGFSRLDWLESYHTFSFGDYHDPRHLGFRSLRVINEDQVAPGRGFNAHPHADMEILSYVISGALKHTDNRGHTSTIQAGDAQKITAGSGIVHSEFNASSSLPVHFLQVWIKPAHKGLTPSYQERSLGAAGRGALELIASSAPGEVIAFDSDVAIYRGVLGKGQGTVFELRQGRGLWVQVIAGKIEVLGEVLFTGDGAALEEPGKIKLQAADKAVFLLFDLA